MTIGMIEPVPAPEFYVSGLGRVEDIGNGCFRLYWYVRQAPIEAAKGTPQENVVAMKFILHTTAMPDALLRMLQAMAERHRPNLSVVSG